MNSLFFVPVVFFVVGVLFIGASFTGLVISESCCFPPNCIEENICDAAKAPVTEAASLQVLVGILFVLVAGFTFRFVAQP